MVLTGINTILRFLYVLSKKYQLWQENKFFSYRLNIGFVMYLGHAFPRITPTLV